MMTTDKLPYSLGWIAAEAVETVRDPRGAAGRMLALNLPGGVLWQALALVVCVSVVLGQGTVLLAVSPGDMAGPTISPLGLAMVQFALLAIMAVAVHAIGRSMGGQGDFAGALTLITWLQVVMVCLQVLQAAAFLLLPPLAMLLGWAGLILFLWLLTNFVAVLHGFQSLGLVFVMILMSAFAIAFVLTLVLAVFGVTPPGGFDV